jgi:hypothetical protein
VIDTQPIPRQSLEDSYPYFGLCNWVHDRRCHPFLNCCYHCPAAAGPPVKTDREQARRDFAGWRVNYDRALILLCGLVMAPRASWSSDRLPEFVLPPFFLLKKHNLSPESE